MLSALFILKKVTLLRYYLHSYERALAQAAAIERGVGLLPLQIRRHQEELTLRPLADSPLAQVIVCAASRPSSMPKKKKWREPELPWSLQDELNPDRVRDAKAPKKKAVGANRKQMRKEARQQKKVRPRPPGRPKSEPEPEPQPEPDPPPKEKKRAAAPAPAPVPAKKKKPSHTPTAFEEMLRERGVLKSTEGRGAGGQSMDALDDHIDDLERKLGLKKGKTAKAAKQRLERELAEDGLSGRAAGSKARLVSRSSASARRRVALTEQRSNPVCGGGPICCPACSHAPPRYLCSSAVGSRQWRCRAAAGPPRPAADGFCHKGFKSPPFAYILGPLTTHY